MPGYVGVEALHLFELFECIWAEVLLVDNAVVADHERLYTGDAVFGGRGDESEAADHDSFDDVVEFSERGGGALSFEDFEEVTVIGRFSGVVTLCDGASSLFADWALPLTVGSLPGEAVLFTGSADDALSVLVYAIELARSEGVGVLGFDEAVANLDGIEFVGADAAVEEFLLASLGVKGPFAIDFDDGCGEGPALIADEDEETPGPDDIPVFTGSAATTRAGATGTRVGTEPTGISIGWGAISGAGRASRSGSNSTWTSS